MKKQLVVALLAMLPIAESGQAFAQNNVLSGAKQSSAFAKNALSGGESALSTRNVLSPKGAKMDAGNAIPDNRAAMNGGNAIPENQAAMKAGNAIEKRSAGLDAQNAIGRGESALQANNVIEKRSAGLSAGNVMNGQGVQASARQAFSTDATKNALSGGNGVDARRQLEQTGAVDARRVAFRARVIEERSNAFGNEEGVTVGGVGGALEVATPGPRNGVAGSRQADNALASKRSAFSADFSNRVAERNKNTKADQWREAKKAFDGTITETKPSRNGFGKSAFD